jgi:phytol kinase
MTLILTVLIIFGLLVGSELWWRHKRPNDEFSRKFIHIFVGSLAATWPFYLSWDLIILLSAAFIVVVSLSRYFHIFQSIHSVERPTWGEIFFALAVGALVFVTHQPWIYAAALLHMSLADGLAAVVGVTLGKHNQYKVFGHPKSVVGSATFFVTSLIILCIYSAHATTSLSLCFIVVLAAGTTAIENLGVEGIDNLVVPLLVGIILSQH